MDYYKDVMNVLSLAKYFRYNGSELSIIVHVYTEIYGTQNKQLFIKTNYRKFNDAKRVIGLMRAPILVEPAEAFYKVYKAYLESNDEAREYFVNLKSLETQDDDMTTAFKRLYAELTGKPTDVVEPVPEEATEELPATEEVLESSTDIEEVHDISDEIHPTPETPEDTEDVKEESEPINDAESSVDIIDEDDQLVNASEVSIVSDTSPEVPEDATYKDMLHGRITNEVKEYILIPNKNTALALAKAILRIVKDKDVMHLVYDKDFMNALFEEFDRSVSLLSAFRISIIALYYGGMLK